MLTAQFENESIMKAHPGHETLQLTQPHMLFSVEAKQEHPDKCY